MGLSYLNAAGFAADMHFRIGNRKKFTSGDWRGGSTVTGAHCISELQFGLQHPSLAFHSHQMQCMQGAQLFLLSPEGTCIQLHTLIYTFTLSESHELWNTLEIPAPRRQRWTDPWGLWLASLVCEMNFRPEKIPLSQITRWKLSANAINPNNEETRGWHIYVTLKPARTRVCLNNQVVSFTSIHIYSSELL